MNIVRTALIISCVGLFLASASVAFSAAHDQVSLEQVLKDPDNVDLNYRYAKSEVKKGNLRGALTALERILAVNPNLPNIRLFYAFVLNRLDSLDEAQRQLDQVDFGVVPQEIRPQVADLRRRISFERKRTLLSGSLGLGWEYDTNRNFSTSSGQILFFDSLFDNAKPQSDTNLFYTGNIDIRRDLGGQAGHEVFGSFKYYRTQQTQLSVLDLQMYSLQCGGVFKSPYFHLTPTFAYDYVLLDQALYLRNHGGGLKIDHNITPKWTLYAEARDTYQDFTPTDMIPDAAARSGIQVDLNVGTDWVIAPNMKMGFTYNYANKHALNAIYAFRRNAVTLSHSWLLGKGTFLQSNVTASFDRYPMADEFISVMYRHDNSWHATVNYGVPMSLLSDSLQDLTWVFTYDYFQSVSSLPNYSYTNNKLATLLTYKWNAGW